MIKIYKIKLNGKVYEVEVESVIEKEASLEKQIIKKTENNEEISIEAPMQGTILDIFVNIGDKVNKGDPVLLLEAMKMENQVVSPVNGTISSILVSKGDTVNLGEIIIKLD